jgi:hypothetical protein
MKRSQCAGIRAETNQDMHGCLGCGVEECSLRFEKVWRSYLRLECGQRYTNKFLGQRMTASPNSPTLFGGAKTLEFISMATFYQVSVQSGAHILTTGGHSDDLEDMTI